MRCSELGRRPSSTGSIGRRGSQNLRGAFVMRAGTFGPGEAIVVDDIITTTATLEACASVLVTAEQAVYGFAVAREV